MIDPVDEWRESLQRTRKQLGLGRNRLAELSGVSAAIIRAYEAGRRHPTLPTLNAIIEALRIDQISANAIRDGAGFARARTIFSEREGYFYEIDELDEAIRQPWPVFVTSQFTFLVAVNDAACRLWGFDFNAERCRKSEAEMSFQTVAAQLGFDRRITNFGEFAYNTISVLKGGLVGDASDTQMTPAIEQRIKQVSGGSEAALRMIATVWAAVPGTAARVRWTYPMGWNDPTHGELRFVAVVSTANEREALTCIDWIPTDAETWRTMCRIMCESASNETPA